MSRGPSGPRHCSCSQNPTSPQEGRGGGVFELSRNGGGFRLLPFLTKGPSALFLARIGFAIARRLAQDGAHVVLSSRKQANVDRAVAELRGQSLSVSGLVCHVGKAEDRQRLVDAVRAGRALGPHAREGSDWQASHEASWSSLEVSGGGEREPLQGDWERWTAVPPNRLPARHCSQKAVQLHRSKPSSEPDRARSR